MSHLQAIFFLMFHSLSLFLFFSWFCFVWLQYVVENCHCQANLLRYWWIDHIYWFEVIDILSYLSSSFFFFAFYLMEISFYAFFINIIIKISFHSGYFPLFWWNFFVSISIFILFFIACHNDFACCSIVILMEISKNKVWFLLQFIKSTVK